MTPVINPFDEKRLTKIQEIIRGEIMEFMESDCKYAYVYVDEEVTVNRNIGRYNDEIRKMRIPDVRARQAKGRVILQKGRDV